MTVSELTERMSVEEFTLWAGFMQYRQQEEEKMMRKAKARRR